MGEVKTTFSIIRSAIESFDPDRFAFRRLVYPKPTSNAQKAPFFAVFMAFHQLIYREGLSPPPGGKFLESLNDLADRIKVGQKHIKSDDRLDNIKITSGLIRASFTAEDKTLLTHGPGLLFDFENSIRRSRTETARYEFKQGILRLDGGREVDSGVLQDLVQTICAIANVGPESNGYIYVGVADKAADAKRIRELDGIEHLTVTSAPDVMIVGVDREARVFSVPLDRYMRRIVDAISGSALSQNLKTQVLSYIDVIDYKGVSVVRITIPKQTQASFLGDDCYVRQGSATHKATGPQIAAVIAAFAKAA